MIIKLLAWFSRVRQLGIANAIGLLSGLGLFAYLETIGAGWQEDWVKTMVDNACSFFTFCGNFYASELTNTVLAVGLAYVLTKLYNKFSPTNPKLQEIEAVAEEILDHIPTLENPSLNKPHSSGAANGNYNK